MLAWPDVRRAVVLVPDELDAGSGSRLVATLRVGGKRELAVFAIAAERWMAARRAGQPLTRWLEGVTDPPRTSTSEPDQATPERDMALAELA